jgi:hypothetical protein
MKIHPVGAELFHADRQTDRHDEASVIVAFRNFATAPGKQIGLESRLLGEFREERGNKRWLEKM